MNPSNHLPKVVIYCRATGSKQERIFHTAATMEMLLRQLSRLSTLYEEGGAVLRPDDGVEPRNRSDRLFVWDRAHFRRVRTAEIIRIEAARSYSTLHLDGSNRITLSFPMASALPYLDGHHFLRVHRSSIVNLDFVESLTGNMLTLRNGDRILVGREYRQGLIERFDFLGTRSPKYRPPCTGK